MVPKQQQEMLVASAIYGLEQRIQITFAFYGLIACKPHLCETVRRRKRGGGGKRVRETQVEGIPQARLSLLWVRCHWMM